MLSSGSSRQVVVIRDQVAPTVISLVGVDQQSSCPVVVSLSVSLILRLKSQISDSHLESSIGLWPSTYSSPSENLNLGLCVWIIRSGVTTILSRSLGGLPQCTSFHVSTVVERKTCSFIVSQHTVSIRVLILVLRPSPVTHLAAALRRT